MQNSLLKDSNLNLNLRIVWIDKKQLIMILKYNDDNNDLNNSID